MASSILEEVFSVLSLTGGPFSPSRRLAILGGALIFERPVRVMATGTLGHHGTLPSMAVL
ncbi:MAG TPA: hypothetical protein VMW91_02695 [Desulfosporosinus sp.]|nr:hypothetical protein [Desulfosporosinus sp.]